MKKIEAIVKRDKLSFVKRGLADIGFPALTITEVTGRGKQGSPIEIPGSEKIYADPLPKVKIEIIAIDSDCEKIVKKIIEKASTNKIGDGKIFISEISNVYRVRDGESGEKII